MSVIDFTRTETEVVQKHMDSRWKEEKKPLHLADIEITKKGDATPSACPALVWEDKKTTFVVLKLGGFLYKSFFYFKTNERFDSGTDEYSDLSECVDGILKAQANLILSMNVDDLKV